MTPTYLHDCTGCKFLGSYPWKGKVYDLYTCAQGCNWPTVIARYSPDGPDYISGMEIAKELITNPKDDDDRTHPLVEAVKRGKSRGLITRKDAQ